MEGNFLIKFMRVIGGKLKGKSINFLKSKKTRPLKDSVRENIFNILMHSNLIKVKVDNANILDLYSGIGSFGIECVSRGARKITFVEKDSETSNILVKNLEKLSLEKQTIVFNDKISNFLKMKKIEKFEIIFLDPPFADNSYIDYLEKINTKKIYKKNHLLIIHRDVKTDDKLDNIINHIKTKKYGRSKIIFGEFLT